MSDCQTQVSGAPAHVLPESYPVCGLLPAGSQIPPRYRRVCAQLQRWGLPDDLVQLGLIMRALERGGIDPGQLAPLLGEEAVAVARSLVEINNNLPRPSLQQNEQLWKFFTLTYLHPSASLLKVTELFVQLYATPHADTSISIETVTAAAHVCARLGMWDIRAEVLNARAQLADPHLFRRASELLERSWPARTQFFESLQARLADLLQAQGVAGRVERRPRPIHQVVEDGMENVQSTFPWADVVVLLIEDIQDCYRALGAINSAYPVVGSKVRDFIGGPKENGYQAIHTAIEYTAAAQAERSAPVDIRITTSAMDRYNRDGYLAYVTGIPIPQRRPLWWADRQRWQAAYRGESAELFVFTPKGEAIFLPREATVLDFAVRVHSNLGVYCRGARVNGHPASPGDRLECGDICEVLIDQYSEPIAYRQIDSAGTTSTRARIRRALQKDHTGAVRGRHIFRTVLMHSLETQEVHSSEELIDQQIAALCRERGYQTVDAFYRAVARGEVAPDPFIRIIISNLLVPRLDFESIPAEVRMQARRIRLALCCKPRPSQAAVAVPIHKGHELKIHSAHCSHIAEPAYPTAWRPGADHTYVADVLYEGWDRPGLIHDVTGALARIGSINILAFSASVPEPSLARLCFSFEAPSQHTIDQARRTLEQLPEQRNVDVRTVRLIHESPRVAEPLENPYGPQPVGRWPFFVGRSTEVRQIIAHLGGPNGTNHILIRGPKRIGKSSLLQHLSRYHLQDFEVPELLDLQSLPNEDLYLPRLLHRIAAMIAHKAGPRARNAVLDTQALARDPIPTFGAFLSAIRHHNDLDRFVILIDEFGVIFSRLQGSPRAAEFYDQWRALLSDATVSKHLAFVVVLPDQSVAKLQTSGPASVADEVAPRIGELGYPVRLSLLDADTARELIITPIRRHLAYRPADLDLLLQETGGHPYYIHLVCGAIVINMQIQQRKTGLHTQERQEIPSEIVHEALATVAGNEDAFFHILADSTPETAMVLHTVAAMTNDARPCVSRARLRNRLRRVSPLYRKGVITRALEERPDLLVATGDMIGIQVALVARWLRRLAEI